MNIVEPILATIPTKYENLKGRLSKEYELGVKSFINFEFSNTNDSFFVVHVWNVKIVKNKVALILEIKYVNEIDESYKIWFLHGEITTNSSLCIKNLLSLTFTCMKRMMLEV